MFDTPRFTPAVKKDSFIRGNIKRLTGRDMSKLDARWNRDWHNLYQFVINFFIVHFVLYICFPLLPAAAREVGAGNCVMGILN